MNKVVSALIPAAAFGLNIICPAIPAFVWSALINAVLSGNVELSHIQEFLKDHDIHTYAEYPTGRNGA